MTGSTKGFEEGHGNVFPSFTAREIVDYIEDFHVEDGFWYLAAPYTNYQAGHDESAARCHVAAAYFIRENIPIFSPIAHSHVIATEVGLDKVDHDMWMWQCKPLYKAAYGFIGLCLEGFEESRGFQEEVRHFSIAQKPIYMLRENGI